MAEGRAEQERQPIISNLFPVSEKSVLSAFRNLISKKNPSSVQEAVEKELKIMRKTNPYVLASIDDLLEYQTKKEEPRMRLGSLICNRALREEANARGGVLPTLAKDFVEQYDEELERKLGEEVEDKWLAERSQVGPQMRRAYIAKFRNYEPDFSKIVEEEFGNQPDWVPENDFRYTGLAYQYLLFRQGFSDPKNFQK